MKALAEFRAPLPGMKLPSLSRRAAIAGAALLLVVCAGFAARGKIAVKKVWVEGNSHASEKEILSIAGVQPGDPWLLFDAAGVKRRVRTHPWIDDVVVGRPWPGSVRLAVRENVPVALLDWGGERHGLAEDMKILPAHAADSSALPQIRGFTHRGKRGIDLEALERALIYVKALRRERTVSSIPVILTLHPSGRDVLAAPGMGIDVVLEEAIPPEILIKNFAAFLETLDSPGECRGTLRVFSKTTAVWAGKV
jgi:hypothetical protein